jgi:hypothetical protein
METKNAEIELHNGFPNPVGEGNLLVGIITAGIVHEDALLLIGEQEVKMYKIETIRDSVDDVVRIQFEVERNLNPEISWWKLFGSKIKVKNTTHNNGYSK